MEEELQDAPSADSGADRPAAATSRDLFREVEEAVREGGTERAFDRLLKGLEETSKYRELFEAILMKRRHELKLPLIQIGQATDLADELVPAYEDAIAEACRKVGGLYLEQGDLVQAWPYLRALGETEGMKKALENVEPGTRRKDIDGIVEIALNEGVHPSRGLEIVVHHYGICSSITNYEQFQLTMRSAEREACVRILIRTLYDELLENLRSEVESAGKKAPKTGLLALIDQPELFEDDAYYVDSSHLWSIVRFSATVSDGPELELAVELAEYGSRLSSVYQYNSEAPFEDYYKDQAIYLRGLRGVATEDDAAVERAGAHFLDKARRALAEENQDYPVGDVLTILTRLGRFSDALDLALGFEKLLGPNRPFSPSLFELCQMATDFDRLGAIARDRGDVVSFAAGVLQQGGGNGGNGEAEARGPES